MKIGFPSHPRRDLLTEIRWIADHGFQFVDLFLEPDLGAADRVQVAETRALLRETGLDHVGHLAWYVPTGSPLAELRRAAVTLSCAYFDVFQGLGTRNVTIHANWPSGMFSAQEGIDLQVETLLQLVPAAAARDCVLMFEPVGHAHETDDALRQILDRVPGLAFHLDVGHFNLHGRNPLHAAQTFKDHLTHVHLHDNDGSRDQHLPMGTGTIDWDTFIPGLKKIYDGTITLEVFSREPRYALLTKELLRQRWDAA